MHAVTVREAAPRASTKDGAMIQDEVGQEWDQREQLVQRRIKSKYGFQCCTSKALQVERVNPPSRRRIGNSTDGVPSLVGRLETREELLKHAERRYANERIEKWESDSLRCEMSW